MNASRLSPRERLILKRATRQLVERAGGPTEAAESCRPAASLLSRYCSESEEHETTFAPADVVKELELLAGEPIVTRALADLGGFDLVARKAVSASADYESHDADIVTSACALMVAWRERKADGRLCANDLAALEHLAGLVQAELAEFRADARRDLDAAAGVAR